MNQIYDRTATTQSTIYTLIQRPSSIPLDRSAMSHPHSLFVHSKETHTQPYRASTSHPADDNFHRRNVEHKKAMKKELDGWMDLLMESDRVERGVLKRAVSDSVDNTIWNIIVK